MAHRRDRAGYLFHGDRTLAAHPHALVRARHWAKTDTWLVRTVGVLVTVIGGSLLSAAVRRTITAETAGIGIGAAAGLAAIDTVFSAKRRISPIYLADAVVEAAFITAWLYQSDSIRNGNRGHV